MEEKKLLKEIAMVINDKFIELEVDIMKPSLYERLKKIKVRRFSVRRASLSTLLAFGELVLEFESNYYEDRSFTVSDFVNAICTDARTAVKAMAVLLLNTDNTDNPSLEKFLLKNLDNDDYKEFLLRLIEHSRIENFMSSIILVKGMSLLKTKEMIAFGNKISGQLSEEL